MELVKSSTNRIQTERLRGQNLGNKLLSSAAAEGTCHEVV
jgi:hypothetical protein